MTMSPEEGPKDGWTKGLEHLSCENTLRQPRFFSLKNRRLWGDLTVTLQCLKGACRKAGEGLCQGVQ